MIRNLKEKLRIARNKGKPYRVIIKAIDTVRGVTKTKTLLLSEREVNKLFE